MAPGSLRHRARPTISQIPPPRVVAKRGHQEALGRKAKKSSKIPGQADRHLGTDLHSFPSYKKVSSTLERIFPDIDALVAVQVVP